MTTAETVEAGVVMYEDLRWDWMTDDQLECVSMLYDLVPDYRGSYRSRNIKPCGSGISVSFCSDMSSFDFCLLTNAVLMAHDRMIRIEVEPCNMQYLRLKLHKRHCRDGLMHERHPTIEEAIARERKARGRGFA